MINYRLAVSVKLAEWNSVYILVWLVISLIMISQNSNFTVKNVVFVDKEVVRTSFIVLNVLVVSQTLLRILINALKTLFIRNAPYANKNNFTLLSNHSISNVDTLYIEIVLKSYPNISINVHCAPRVFVICGCMIDS